MFCLKPPSNYSLIVGLIWPSHLLFTRYFLLAPSSVTFIIKNIFWYCAEWTSLPIMQVYSRFRIYSRYFYPLCALFFLIIQNSPRHLKFHYCRKNFLLIPVTIRSSKPCSTKQQEWPLKKHMFIFPSLYPT